MLDRFGSRDNSRGNTGSYGVSVEPAALLRLSARDRKKALKMMENGEAFDEESGGEGEWRRELQVMLMLNVKAEMEILAEKEGGVEGWVERRLIEEAGLKNV